MTRERLLVVILLPIIGAAVYWVWNAANEANNPKPSVAEAVAPEPPPSPALQRVIEGVAYEDVPQNRSAEDQDIVNHAKDAPASMLDSSLPHQSIGYWIAHAAGSAARLRWDVNNCPGADKQPDSTPVCAQANIDFSNGTKFEALLLLGEKPTNPTGAVKYTQPSLLWASYQKTRGALIPADLSGLPQIAQQAN